MVNKFKVQLYLPKDPIIREGSYGNKVCFISSGSVLVSVKKQLDKAGKTMSQKTLAGSVFKKAAMSFMGLSAKNMKDDDERKTLIDGDDPSD